MKMQKDFEAGQRQHLRTAKATCTVDDGRTMDLHESAQGYVIYIYRINNFWNV